MDGRGARAGAGGDGEEMAGEVWQAQPAAASASRRPCTIVCPPVIVRPRRARRAGCGGWCREGKGCSRAGGVRRSPGWASAPRGSPSGARPARPFRRSLRSFPLGDASVPAPPLPRRYARLPAQQNVHNCTCTCPGLSGLACTMCQKAFWLANTDPAECISLYMQRMPFSQLLMEETFLLDWCAIYA